MTASEIYILSYNHEIDTIFTNLKAAYLTLYSRLSPKETMPFKSYSQVHRDMQKVPEFHYSPRPHAVYTIKRYPVRRTFQ